MSLFGVNNTIKTQRLVKTSNLESYPTDTYQLENVDCYIEQEDPKVAIILDNVNFAETYNCFVDGQPDILISDKIIDENNNEYIVNGVQKFANNNDVDDHVEIIMYKPFKPI